MNSVAPSRRLNARSARGQLARRAPPAAWRRGSVCTAGRGRSVGSSRAAGRPAAAASRPTALQQLALEPLPLPDGVVGVLHRQLRQGRGLALGEGLVQRRQLAHQHAHRPAVGDDVVHASAAARAPASASRSSRSRNSGPAARSNGRRASAWANSLHLGGLARSRAAPSGQSHVNGRLGGRVRCAGRAGRRRWGRWSARTRGGGRSRPATRRRRPSRAGPRSRPRRACCRRGCPARAGPGTTAAAGQTTAATRPAAARPAAAAPDRRHAAPGRGPAASAATVGCSNSCRSGSSSPDSGADPRGRLGRQQRVAAQLEEVVVDADPLQAQHLGPDVGEHLLAGVRGRRVGTAAAGCRSGAGSAWRSTLPLGVSGSASSTTKAEGTMYSGSLPCRKARSSAAVGRPRSGPPGRPPGACRPGRPRAPAPRPAAPPGAAAAPPRSRPARCGSRGS